MNINGRPDFNGDRISEKVRAELLKLAESLKDGDRSASLSPQTRKARYRALLSETGDPQLAQAGLERLIGGNDLVGIAYLERGLTCARSVCRIHLRDANGTTTGFGTGFLVAPGVVMTNHHVIGSPEEAQYAVAEFDYELDAKGRDRAVTTFQLVPGVLADPALDFCLVNLASRSTDGARSPEEYGWLVLDGTPNKAFVGEYLTVIQHPGGERKQICVRENKLLKYDDEKPVLWYQTDTVAGSSGSPVFNQSWQVVALHHSAVAREDKDGNTLAVSGKPWNPKTDDDSMVDWFANEGIRISKIVKWLAEENSDLARAVLEARPATDRESANAQRGAAGLLPSGRIEDQELRVTVPVQIAVRVGDLPRVGHARQPAPAARAAAPARVRPAAIVGPIADGTEKVEIDQDNYPDRPGYDPDFLGGGARRVPLPDLNGAQRDRAVALIRDGEGIELKYWNYSVVLDRDRRLAFYSAVNVDAAKRPKGAGRSGDKWYADTRVGERLQLGSEFYSEQANLEADRTANPFDRGHLTRRLDAQWGTTAAKAKRNGDDSFHWTNCAPQHWQFNQGAKRWLGLEDYVIATFAEGGKACVINGPIFDAPISKRSEDGTLRPALGGKRHPDPTFKGVAIPKAFFKIVACPGVGGRLSAAAFYMSQEDFLLGIDRLKGMPETDEKLTKPEARMFQVRVKDIEKLTGLDFGPLAEADEIANEALAADRAVDVEEVQRFTRTREAMRVPMVGAGGAE